jgi:hypothetical protein
MPPPHPLPPFTFVQMGDSNDGMWVLCDGPSGAMEVRIPVSADDGGGCSYYECKAERRCAYTTAAVRTACRAFGLRGAARVAVRIMEDGTLSMQHLIEVAAADGGAERTVSNFVDYYVMALISDEADDENDGGGEGNQVMVHGSADSNGGGGGSGGEEDDEDSYQADERG